MKIQLKKQEPKKRSGDFRYKKEALALVIAVLIALIVLILTSGSPGTPQTNQTAVNQTPEQINTKIYSAGGIYLEYPESWKVTTDEKEDKNVQVVIQDPTSANNPNSTQAAGFTVFKVQKDPYETVEQRKDSFIEGIKSSGANINEIYSNNTNINGINAVEKVYDGTGPKNEKIQLKVIYFEQSDIIYILACLTKGMPLENQKANFDVIINSFKLQ